MASSSQGSDEDYSLVCLPCHRDKNTVPAFGYCIDCKEHLCHFCYTRHKTPTPCRHHRLQDKDAMPAIQHLTDTPVADGTTDNLTTPCPRHQTEKIKLYCRDHDLLLCSICVTLEHNNTCHVDYIPDISDQMVDSQVYKRVIGQMDRMLTKCSNIKTETLRDTNKSNDSLDNVLMEIQKYRRDVNTRLDEMQSKVENKIQALVHQHDEKKNLAESICDDVKKIVKAAYDSMKQLNASKQADQLFIQVKQVQEKLQEYKSSIRSISTEEGTDEYIFIPSQAINDALFNEQMIGDISAKHQAREHPASAYRPPSTSVSDITQTCMGGICVKSSADKERCWITGMAMIHPDKLVLADRGNRYIKLIDVNSKSTILNFRLGITDEDSPWDVTSTSSSQVAVTVPDRQHIQFISVSNMLSKTHTIQTDGQCYGICCHQNKLVVTYKFPAKLEILDMQGRVMTNVATDPAGVDVFNEPMYVHSSSRYIYVSDRGREEVIMLSWQGTITGIARIQLPTGLAMLGDGSLLVCDYYNDKVLQISEDCTNKRIMLQSVGLPYSVCTDEGGHKLYISRDFVLDNSNNSILEFNI